MRNSSRWIQQNQVGSPRLPNRSRMKEAGSLQRLAWHRAGPDSDSDCKVEAIDFNSAPQPRGDQSQERSSSLKSYADLLRSSAAGAPRGFPAYDRRLSLAVSGRTNRRIAGGKAARTPNKKVRPAPSLTPTAETESEIPLAVGPVPIVIAATPRTCTGPQAQGIIFQPITRRIWVIHG